MAHLLQLQFRMGAGSGVATNPCTGRRFAFACGPMQMGWIQANDGTRILAYINLSENAGFDTDCHGTTFASGEVWINNDEVGDLLKGDGYERIERDELKVGDVVVYTDEKGNTVHSMTVSSVDPKSGKVMVYGQGGIEVSNHSEPIDEAWEGGSQTYYRRTKSVEEEKSDGLLHHDLTLPAEMNAGSEVERQVLDELRTSPYR